MLIRTAVLRRQKDKPDELLIKPEDLLVENQDEAKLTILMSHSTELEKIPKKGLVVVCSDFLRV